MDTIVEDKDVLFPQVFSHLDDVQTHSGTITLDEDLLKRAERSLDSSTPQELLIRLLFVGENLLQTLQQDPRPLTRVLERTVLLIPFDELKTSISTSKLEEGLQSPSEPVKLLCLAYLKRASDSPSGAAFVAASSSLSQCLVSTWLSTQNTEVAERALETVVALLAVDNPESLTVANANRTGEAQGHGLIWRRLFYDPDVYSLLFEWTSTVKSNHDLKSKIGLRQVTISQGRLFDFVVRISQIDWTAITTSTLPEVESLYASSLQNEPPYKGLLRYVTWCMIDPNDYLMVVIQRDFFLRLQDVLDHGYTRNATPQLVQTIRELAGVDSRHPTNDAGMHL